MAQVIDPVCGMTLDSSQAAAQTIYQGQTYFFCSVDCRQTFEQNPKEFTKGQAAPTSSTLDQHSLDR